MKGAGLLARIPKQSQMDLAASANLRYQCVCFQRAAPSGHVPWLHSVIEPSDGMPRGALLVEEIVGMPASEPRHLAPIMQALAAIHALPVPVPQDCAPLLNEPDPLAGIVALIDAQARHLDHPTVPAASARAVKARLADLTQRMVPVVMDCPQRLITFDAHPGNFLITPSGKAVLVDLEKLRYSYPPLDLAHATLYTSTTWDRDASFELPTEAVARAYEVWAAAVGEAIAGPCRRALVPLVPLRELMWLWSVTWCAKWLAESAGSHRAGGDGEDWSARHSEAALIEHVRGRVNDYLSIRCIERMLAEFHDLQAVLAT
ncbi:hypothetical protein H010_18635 [Hydrogenophaga taeniospiralis CCUG 15921]|uniref:Aminoglycoside phosphotransferase domain-containing protein n=1 Tax=Hydrogenophaga taeniospiralis CCUG 15921 TaxID=1281780 RepID=A0A9X4SBA8_9BURK|nr:hypothetical protein [Hydrogenophaga taeniospiralis CCUG 15921]